MILYRTKLIEKVGPIEGGSEAFNRTREGRVELYLPRQGWTGINRDWCCEGEAKITPCRLLREVKLRDGSKKEITTSPTTSA